MHKSSLRQRISTDRIVTVHGNLDCSDVDIAANTAGRAAPNALSAQSLRTYNIQ